MQYKQRFFYIFNLFLLSSHILSGNTTKILTYTFEWNNVVKKVVNINNTSHEYIDFNGAVLNDSLLPVFFQVVGVGSMIENVKIINPVYETYPKEYFSLISGFSFKNYFDLKYFLNNSSGEKFLNIQIIPYRINELNGKIERLISCNIEITFSSENNLKKAMADRYVKNSALKNGKWYKFKVTETGIYALSYNEIKNIGFSDPENIAVYGLEGGMLNDINNGNEPDDVKEIPIRFNKGSDGVFNNNDIVVFYLKGPTKWKFDNISGIFRHEQHNYSNYAYYFITDIKKGREIEKQINSTSVVTHNVNSFNDYAYHESDNSNFIQSGREWYGEEFSMSVLSRTFNFQFPNLIRTIPINLTANILSRSEGAISFDLKINSQPVNSYSIASVNIKDYTSIYAREKNISETVAVNNDNVEVTLNYNRYNADSKGYLDFICINAERNLIMSGTQMEFRNIASVGGGNVSNFALQNMVTGNLVWEITDFHNIKEIQGTMNGSAFEFILETDTLRQFIAFKPENYLKPELEGDDAGFIENQDLHSLSTPDYLIITHNNFEKQAIELAEFHRSNSGLSVTVVDQQKIFNEFSSGARDICAIRNFVKMFYDRSENNKLRYLLFFGDGSFDNKNIVENNYNFLLTYQSKNSLEFANSFVSDDFFGLLDDNEEIISGALDVGIGRFPVKDTIQARTLINKVMTYMGGGSFGDWRNTICMIGDDEDGNIHMKQADDLAKIVQNKFPWFNSNKILLDAYKQVSTSNGARYPDVNKAIFNQLKKGTLIMNYTGHGAEWGLAHEQILNNVDINNWSNWGKFPVFMTATCEFSRFDYTKTNDKKEYTSTTTTGENVVLHPKGGAVASFSTTRLVYSFSNFELNQNFYKYVFEFDTVHSERNRLGDVVRLSKNATSAGLNKRNFSLLGDPALILSYPEHKIKIDSINSADIPKYTDCIDNRALYTKANSLYIYYDSLCTHHDTLCEQADLQRSYMDSLFYFLDSLCASIDAHGALSFINISGHVEKKEGGMYYDFNGELTATIYDKPENITTLDNDKNDNPFNFKLQSNTIYKGKASVENGYFNITFLVPKDIAYMKGKGKISCYAHNGVTDASGWDTSLVIGGFNDSSEITDNEGPDIKMYMNDPFYKEEGITNESPTLVAFLEDESGINTTTSGIGHEMVAVLDNNFSSLFVMNDFYESELNNYKKGQISYPLVNLEPGEHIIWIKVWDVLNNSSESELKFNVVESNKLIIQNVYNYPNPFNTSTKFVVEHNLPDELLDITIRIFDMSGRLVKILNEKNKFESFMSPVIEWDGKLDNGSFLKGGLYFYHVLLSSDKGDAEKTSKMIIIR